MVVIVGAIPGRLVLDLARRVRKNVPDRAAAAVFIDGALDLIGRGGDTPRKTFGKSGGSVRIGGRFRLVIGRMRRRRRHSERSKACEFAKLPTREFSEHRP